MTFFEPASSLSGSLRPASDKSISHRAAILGALSSGTTAVENYLDSGDTRSTLAAVDGLGASLSGVSDRSVAPVIEISGVGLGRFQSGHVNTGNASTLARVISGLLAAQPGGEWVIDGDLSFRTRPMDRIADPLNKMGARVRLEGRKPPIRIWGQRLHGITWPLPMPSAQVKSSILFAGLLADGTTRVIESVIARDHTERMLAAAGVNVAIEYSGGRRVVSVRRVAEVTAPRFHVPADFSSAAFFLVAGCLVPDSELVLRDVGVNPTRTGLWKILERMGAKIEVVAARELSGEPVADLRVRTSTLTGTCVGPAEVPSTIDELPLVALAGCLAKGETVVRGAAELRHKESDRISGVVAGLRALGADITELPDGFRIRGGRLTGGTLNSFGDHRLAMLGAIAGVASEEGVRVVDMGAAGISYPSFVEDLSCVGGRVATEYARTGRAVDNVPVLNAATPAIR